MVTFAADIALGVTLACAPDAERTVGNVAVKLPTPGMVKDGNGEAAPVVVVCPPLVKEMPPKPPPKLVDNAL